MRSPAPPHNSAQRRLAAVSFVDCPRGLAGEDAGESLPERMAGLGPPTRRPVGAPFYHIAYFFVKVRFLRFLVSLAPFGLPPVFRGVVDVFKELFLRFLSPI